METNFCVVKGCKKHGDILVRYHLDSNTFYKKFFSIGPRMNCVKNEDGEVVDLYVCKQHICPNRSCRRTVTDDSNLCIVHQSRRLLLVDEIEQIRSNMMNLLARVDRHEYKLYFLNFKGKNGNQTRLCKIGITCDQTDEVFEHIVRNIQKTLVGYRVYRNSIYTGDGMNIITCCTLLKYSLTIHYEVQREIFPLDESIKDREEYLQFSSVDLVNVFIEDNLKSLADTMNLVEID